jgi:PilZ domain-containing protein
MAARPPKRDTSGTVEVSSPRRPQIAERRAGSRFAFSASAEVTELRSKATIKGRSSDLGFGGCYVDSINTFAEGARVELHLARANHSFEAVGVVIYAHTGMGMGIAFTEIKTDQVELLQEWVRELSGELVPPASPAETPDVRQEAQQGDRLVLNQLIALLIRKRVLTEAEGTALLRDLFN